MKGLSLDGGGVFGIGQAYILANSKLSKFDFFTGTSIGSVLAAKVALGDSVNDLPMFFHSRMPKIFKASIFRKFNPFIPKYPDKELYKSLDIMFGDRKLGEVKKPLFITSVNLYSKKLKVFDSTSKHDQDLKLKDICRSSTAAETYFAPWNGFSDGGIFANNPSMVAVASACSKLNAKIEDIELFSIGTGICDTPDYIKTNGHSRYAHMTLWHWAKWLIDAFMNGSANSMHDYFVKVLPLKKYERIQFALNPKWKMDNPKDMYQAEIAWQEDVNKAIDKLEVF